MNASDAQAALEAVECGDPEALAPLLWENADLVSSHTVAGELATDGIA